MTDRPLPAAWADLKWQLRRAIAITLLSWAQSVANKAGMRYHIALAAAAGALNESEQPYD